MQKENQDYRWVKDIFAKASKEVKSWPAWMKQPEMHNISDLDSEKIDGMEREKAIELVKEEKTTKRKDT